MKDQFPEIEIWNHLNDNKQNTPLVSIITVVYNNVQQIERTIRSVLDQSYSNIEYIVIDGRSTDGTLDIIQKYADRISIVVSEPDRGVYDAMNKGISLSHGDWVNFMNSGDTFHSKSSVEDMDFTTIDNLDTIVYGNCNVIYWDGAKVEEPNEFFNACMKFKGVGICHQTMFFLGERIRGMRYDMKYRIASDYDLTFRMYKENVSFLRRNVVVADYEWGNGISSNPLALVQVYKENARVCGQSLNPFFWGKLLLEYFRYWKKKLFLYN